jgi:hypothetical protein
MRTTLNIGDDVLTVVRDLAKAEKRTIGEVLTDLAHEALRRPAGSALLDAPSMAFDSDFPTFPNRGGPPVTPELIQRIQDEIDMEDAMPFDFITGQPILV